MAFIIAGSPALLQAQFSEIKMGEYLHSATAAANGGIYAGNSSIGYSTPAVYYTNTGWEGLPIAQGFNTSLQIYGSATAISHDGSVVAGYVTGTTPGGVSKQVAAYWVNGVESVVPAPPDDPGAITVTATAISGDGTTLLVQDGTAYTSNVESYVYNIAAGTFTSLGFLGASNHQTFATAINSNGTVVAGYSALDNNNLSGFIWNGTNGLTVLGIPATHPNTIYLEPTCMSDDGTILFGRLTELNGWVGFRYSTTTGYQDLDELPYMEPTACTADGSEAVGIAFLYYPAVWSVSNGAGYLDELMTAHGTPQAIGTLVSPATITPDGTLVTASGPDAYPVDQVWYGAWQISLPFPLKTPPIPGAKQTFYTPYQETLSEPPGTLTQSAEFSAGGVTPVLVSGPHYASSFVMRADGSFTYTPRPGYYSSGPDPETGYPDDRFTFTLTSPNGTSTSNVVIDISVSPPTIPTVDTPTSTSVTATGAILGGIVESDGGATLTAVGVVYAQSSVNGSPLLGGPGVSSASGAVGVGAFTVGVSNLLSNTAYSYAAYASNSLGISYSTVGSFSTLATFQSWQVSWFGGTTATNAAYNADPYNTGLENIAVYAFLGPYQDPSTASVAQLPRVQLSGGNLFYDFFEPGGVSGVTYSAKSCADLSAGNWQPVPDTGNWPEHIFSVSTSAGPQVFMQLSVTAQ